MGYYRCSSHDRVDRGQQAPLLDGSPYRCDGGQQEWQQTPLLDDSPHRGDGGGRSVTDANIRPG